MSPQTFAIHPISKDIWFEIKDPIKEGRKIVGWKIKISKKEKVKREPDESSKKEPSSPLSFDYGIMNQPKQRGNKNNK